METVGKVKQLKDAAEKLAGDTKDKIRRLTGIGPFLPTLLRYNWQLELYIFKLYDVTIC